MNEPSIQDAVKLHQAGEIGEAILAYSLRPGDEKYEDMMHHLKLIFDKYQQNGKVEFLYNTKIHYGRLHERM